MNDPLTTFLIVLLSAVGVISLRRVWRRLREHKTLLASNKAMHDSIQQYMESNTFQHRQIKCDVIELANRITQLENERKD